MSAVASSSKRVPASPPKRPRSDSDSDVEDTPMTDTARAKQARKDARTIRNRESAQRSRNQRKAHMSWLEVRVAELEAENRALKGDTREPSPSLTSISCNTVSLATVAPPPVDLDVKPVIAKTEEPTLTSLQAENAALKERIVLLEDLVKQVVAVSNLAGIEKPTEALAVPSGITQTLSPSFAPVTDTVDTDPFTLVPDQTSNLTCHPAAGEDSFDIFSGDYSTIEHGGEVGSGVGEDFTLGQEFPWDESKDQTPTEVENWDEEMRILLEKLEGKEVQKNEEFGWSSEGLGAEVTV